MSNEARLQSEISLATCDRFMESMGAQPDDHWTAKDIYPIAMRYPGEVFPEGQTWTIKQMGNLFCMDRIRRLGLTRVLEAGAGLNLYFDNHLPDGAESWMADASGFYEEDLFRLVQSRRKRTRFVDCLIGDFSEALPSSHFDAVVSVSVMEHVKRADIPGVAADTFRLLAPGGWSLHSIDVTGPTCERRSGDWLEAHLSAGFQSPTNADLDWFAVRPDGDEVMLEPMSIIQRFHGGYREHPWQGERKKVSNRWGTVLLALQKPPNA